MLFRSFSLSSLSPILSLSFLSLCSALLSASRLASPSVCLFLSFLYCLVLVMLLISITSAYSFSQFAGGAHPNSHANRRQPRRGNFIRRLLLLFFSYLFIYLSIYSHLSSIDRSIHPFIYLIYPSIYRSVYLSNPSIHPFIYPSIYLSFCDLPVMSIYQSTHLSFLQSVRLII